MHTIEHKVEEMIDANGLQAVSKRSLHGRGRGTQQRSVPANSFCRVRFHKALRQWTQLGAAFNKASAKMPTNR